MEYSGTPEGNRSQVDFETIATICGVCDGACGVAAHMEEGEFHRVTPLADHPQGIVCPRGQQAREVVYSPDRILFPQKRVGERGSGKFQRISWDEAFEFMVSSLRQVADRHGPEAVCVYTGRGNFEYGLNENFAPAGTVESSANAVLFPFGSPNSTGVGSLCYVSYGMIAPLACFGECIINMEEDIDHADLVLVWGANPITSSPPKQFNQLKAAKKRGAEIIVIDHRRSGTAKALKAEWIGIRPGTDGALILALINLLIQRSQVDQEFVEKWTHGFADLKTYAAQYTPERAAEICWIPADRIRRLADEIAAAAGLSIVTYTGLEYSNSGVQAIRALFTLQALAGHLDTPGGKLFKMPGRPAARRRLTPPPADGPLPIGAAEYPIYHQVRNEAHGALLPRAILENQPYPLRALIIGGSSLITSWPNPALWRRALASLDLLVCINRFPTADSQYADLLLPASTGFEINSYKDYDGHVQLRRQVIPPAGEARNDYLIYAELAQRLGYGHLWPQTEEGMIRGAIEGLPFTYEELAASPNGITMPGPAMRYRKYALGLLRSDGKPGFQTPTGKFEISSEWFRGYGYQPLPVYTELTEGPLASPEIAEQFPLVFNSGARTQFDFRSQHHNIPSLLKKQPYPQVLIFTADAAQRGIQDGDEVYLSTLRGQVKYRAKVTDDILPGVIEANMGGGGPIGPEAWQQANVNELTDLENRDPISGFPIYKALLCQVTRCAEGGAPPA